MTTTEQIVWAHRVDKRRGGRSPGATLRVYADLLPASDGTAPFAIHTFNQITGGDAIYPAPGGDRQRSLRLHRPGGRRQADGDRPRVRAAARHREAVLRDAGRRHLPLLLSRAGARHAGPVHPRRRLAQPRLRRVRRGRHRRRIDDARLRLGDRLHLLHAREGAARRASRARCSRGSAARTSCSSCCGAGARSSRRACRSSSSTPTGSCRSRIRNTIANMMAEAEALNGIFAPDDDHRRVVSRERASPICRIRASRPAPTPSTRSTRRSTSSEIAPMIAKPFSPGQRVPGRGGRARAAHVRQGDDRLVHQRQLRRSALGGARAPRGARARLREGRARRSRSFRARAASAARSSGPIRASAASRSPTSSDRSADRSGSRGAARASARARTR